LGGAPRERSRWIYAGLIASLALNLLFIGGLAKAFWHHRHGGGRHGDGGLMGFVHKLPADRQAVVRGDIEAARALIRPMRQSVRDAWAETNAVLTAEPFDKDKYKAAVDKLTEAEGKIRAAIASSLVETAAKLTPEERKRMQSWREKRRSHFMGRFGRHDGKGPEGGPGDRD
jgi:Spy/CpxP family protein refolding chaperone